MTRVAKSIAIFGGNGFLGRKICETGVKLGYNVIAFSRSGPAASLKAPWVDQVQWKKGNIFEPETYKHQLEGVDAVVHSIGTLFEDTSYKESLNTSITSNSIQKLGNLFTKGNPMEKSEHKTYGAIQRDSAVLLADTFLQTKGKSHSYVYISADQALPFIPEYSATKREAEQLLSQKERLRTIIMRPGFMYDEKEPNPLNARNLLRFFLTAGYDVKSCLLGNRMELANKLVRPPVSTAEVASTIFEKLEDSNFRGKVTLEEIHNKH